MRVHSRLTPAQRYARRRLLMLELVAMSSGAGVTCLALLGCG